MSLLISITFLVDLILKQWSSFFWTNFFYIRYSILFYFLLGLTGYWIVYFIVIKVSEFFFLLFLRGISFFIWCYTWWDFSIYRKIEILKLSLQASIYEGFSIFLLLLDKLFLWIDLYLFTLLTVFSESIIWVDLDLYIDLFLSVLLTQWKKTEK